MIQHKVSTQTTVIVFAFTCTKTFDAAGMDFNDTSVQLTFTPPNLTMEGRVHCVNISVLDDVEIEVVEYFRVSLSTSDSSVTFNTSTARVAIRDMVSFQIKNLTCLEFSIVTLYSADRCDTISYCRKCGSNFEYCRTE